MNKSKSFLFSFLAVFLALGVTLLAMEHLVRWLIPEFDPSGHVDFIAGHGDRPILGPKNTSQLQIKNTSDFETTINFNKYGFRDSKDLATSTPQDYFAVGDSVSFGWGVDEDKRVSDQMQTLLGQKVFNISIPGDINVSRHLVEYARQQGAVINNLLFFFGTEVRIKNYDDGPGGQKNGMGRKIGPLLHAKIFLMANSAIYFMITSIIHQNPTLKKFAVDAGLVTPNLEGVPVRTFDRKAIESTARHLINFARTMAVNTTIIILPSRSLWVARTRDTENNIYEELISILNGGDIRVLDLRPAFESNGDPLSLFFKNDGHWNASGHLVAAQTVTNFLNATGKAVNQ